MPIYRIEVRDPYYVRTYDVDVPDVEGNYALAKYAACIAYENAARPSTVEENEQNIDNTTFANGVIIEDAVTAPTIWNTITQRWDYQAPDDVLDHPWPSHPLNTSDVLTYEWTQS